MPDQCIHLCTHVGYTMAYWWHYKTLSVSSHCFGLSRITHTHFNKTSMFFVLMCVTRLFLYSFTSHFYGLLYKVELKHSCSWLRRVFQSCSLSLLLRQRIHCSVVIVILWDMVPLFPEKADVALLFPTLHTVKKSCVPLKAKGFNWNR